MTRSVLLGAAALAFTITAARAAEDIYSANYVLPGCRTFVNSTIGTIPLSAGSAALMGECVGRISGIVEMTILLGSSAGTNPYVQLFMCLDIPGKVTKGQIIRVIIAYIEARPARMHESFTTLALEALRDAWPCK